jgi:hypothetical protein
MQYNWQHWSLKCSEGVVDALSTAKHSLAAKILSRLAMHRSPLGLIFLGQPYNQI